jgi:D-alanine--D-alanine ligase
MTRTTVGVLRGGTSSEYDLSLKTGATMLENLPEERYDVRDIFIDRSGMWHRRGMPTDPARALSQVDVVLNALHGGVGENGSVQRILERAGIPYAGARAHAAALSYNKSLARETLRAAGVRMPEAIGFTLSDEIPTAQMARDVFARFGPPYVLKPSAEGGGHGIVIAPTIVDLPIMLADLLETFGSVIVEQFVQGRESVVALIDDFRGEELYALPPLRVVLPEGERILHTGARETARLMPQSDFSHTEKQDLMAIARAAHRALSMSHFSRADIMVTARGVPYLLEVNATPKLYPGAALPGMLESVGSSVREFLEHQIELARRS